MADLPSKLTPSSELGIGEFWQIKQVTGDTLANIYLKEGWEILAWRVKYNRKVGQHPVKLVEYLLGKKEKKF
jgi:hypothetical protein